MAYLDVNILEKLKIKKLPCEWTVVLKYVDTFSHLII